MCSHFHGLFEGGGGCADFTRESDGDVGYYIITASDLVINKAGSDLVINKKIGYYIIPVSVGWQY